MNSAMLKESQKAIERADDQRRLTVLAYFLLPLSIVTSAFGMNVKELGTGSQHIWLPFVVLVPVGVLSWILFDPGRFERVLKLLVDLRQRRRLSHQTHGATRRSKTSSDNGAFSA